MGDMILDRALADYQLDSNLAIGRAQGDEAQHFDFAVSERSTQRSSGMWLCSGMSHCRLVAGKCANQLPSYGGIELIDSRMSQSDGLSQITWRDVFQQIALCPCLQRFDNVFLIIKGRQHKHLTGGKL